MSDTARAWVLDANQPPDRFYAGGPAIADFRGQSDSRPHTPEDWVGSVTTLHGHDRLGLTTLPNGELLRDAIASNPRDWLGRDHVARFGADAALLVKLLDAGQRLPVHVHPDTRFAHRHLRSTHGKTEAWVFLRPAPVWLGFSRDVEAEEVAGWVSDQDTDAMLADMHRLEARAGDAIFVPAGTPHAIGAGALIVELQQPTDLSVLMEWRNFAIDGEQDGHLGLGFPVALTALDRAGRTREEVEAWRESGADAVGPLLPAAADFFRVDRHRGDGQLPAGFSMVVVCHGTGAMTSQSGQTVPLARGATIVVPHVSGEWSVDDAGGLELLHCRPPHA